MKKRVLWLALPMLASHAFAQDTLEEQEAQPDVRRYTVEMIIFAYAQNVSAGSEIFVPDPPPVEDALLDNGFSEETPDEEQEIAYELVMLDEEDFVLLEPFEHLRRLDAYEPLMHFGWTQPTYPDQEVDARPLSFFMTPPDGLEGELKMYLSRYLHLDVKLQLDAARDDVSEDQTTDLLAGDRFNDSFYYDIEDKPADLPVFYRISEDRIFRNGELRYFDHPKFGVLAKITRVEEEDPVEDELIEDGELLGYGVE
jgi:hypothetical protein